MTREFNLVWMTEMVLKLRTEKQVQTFIEHLHARHYIGCFTQPDRYCSKWPAHHMFRSLSRDFTCKQKLEGWKSTLPKHPCTWNPRYNLGFSNQNLLLDFWNWNWVHGRDVLNLRLAGAVIAGVAMSSWSWDNREWSDSTPIMATVVWFLSWRHKIYVKPHLLCGRGNCFPGGLYLGSCSESGFWRLSM